MKRLCSMVLMVGLTGVGLNAWAQQTHDAQTPSTQTQDNTTQGNTMQPQSSTTPSQSGAQSFAGTITKSGDKLVLQSSTSQTAYQLDDQDKAKQYEGKKVTVMATMDSSTNTLNVVDITPSNR